MAALASISDSDLLARLPCLVRAELTATADVIEYLMEVDRRRLYLDQACSSLYAFLTERLGYTEDEAVTRVRVTRLALRFPQVLLELRSGAIHLTRPVRPFPSPDRAKRSDPAGSRAGQVPA